MNSQVEGVNKMMIIKVSELKDNVAEPISVMYEADKLDLEFDDFHYTKGIALSGSLELGEQLISFRGSLESQVELICNRCLSKIQKPLAKDFEFMYEVGDNEEIDASSDLRDLLMLERPDKFVCTETCRGICAQCGKNLNNQTCSCTPEAGGQMPLATLKQLLNRKEEGK